MLLIQRLIKAVRIRNEATTFSLKAVVVINYVLINDDDGGDVVIITTIIVIYFLKPYPL